MGQIKWHAFKTLFLCVIVYTNMGMERTNDLLANNSISYSLNDKQCSSNDEDESEIYLIG